MSEITEAIKEQFKSLPKVIQDTVLNSNWEEKIRRIVKVNNLHVDQGAAIENLVLITMLGIETPEEFVQNAKEYARVSEEQAYNISAEVEREIFGDIRKKLVEISDITGTIDEIDHTTNELNKVATAIEKEATSTTTKPSLKQKIPTDYFNKDYKEPEKPADPYKEPLTEEDVVIDEQPIETKKEIDPAIIIPPTPKAEPKPIFNPMPKEVVAETPISTPTTAKLDPYREPVE